MKRLIAGILFLFPLCGFGNVEGSQFFEKIADSYSSQKNAYIHRESNLKSFITGKYNYERTIDFPTQIVRIHGELKGYAGKCIEVEKEITEFFSSKIDHERFYYNTLIHCNYDPKTELAIHFSMDSYFDPMTDAAVEYLKSFIEDHNGKSLLGTPFYIESAKGLAVSLNIDVGIPQDDYAIVLLRYKHDNATLYFPNNYEMLKYFITDLYKNFYSNEASIVLPFLNRWLFSNAGAIYKPVLKKTNYVLLQPERIFFMSKMPFAYTSPLRMYFSHKCDKYPNKTCL